MSAVSCPLRSMILLVMIVGSVSSIRHDFLPVEQAVGPIKQLLVTMKI